MQVIGLILYNTDYDELATLVGNELKKSHPPNAIVVEYDGPKETFDFYEKRRNNLLTKEDIKKVAPQKKEFMAWKRRTLRKTKADYMLSLHSSPTRSTYKPPWNLVMHIFPSCYNYTLERVLHRYCRDRPLRIAHDPIKRISKDVLIEILHNPSELNVRIPYLWVCDLSTYLNKNYNPAKF